MQEKKNIKKSLRRRRGNRHTKLAQIPLDEENKYAYFKKHVPETLSWYTSILKHWLMELRWSRAGIVEGAADRVGHSGSSLARSTKKALRFQALEYAPLWRRRPGSGFQRVKWRVTRASGNATSGSLILRRWPRPPRPSLSPVLRRPAPPWLNESGNRNIGI
jgi:hypothetical protein